MKSVKLLAIAFAVLTVLVLGFVLLKSCLRSGDNEGAGQVTETGELIISKTEESAISRVTYKSPDISYSVSKGEDGYIWDDDSYFPLSQDAASYLFEFASDIRYERLLEGDVNKSDYGLDSPERVLTVYYDNGDSLALNIGDYNKYVKQYYAMTDNSDSIYLIGSTFTYYYDITLSDVIEHEAPPIPSEEQNDVTEYKVTYKDGSGFFLRYVEGIYDTDDNGNETVILKERWDKIPFGGKSLDEDYTEAAGGLYSAIFGTEHTDWVEYNAIGGGKLQQYGLSPSEVTIEISYNTWEVDEESGVSEKVPKKLTVYLGLASEDEKDDTEDSDPMSPEENGGTKRYFRLEGGEIIYRVSEESFKAVFEK